MRLVEALQQSEVMAAQRKVFSTDSIYLCTIWRQREGYGKASGYGLSYKLLSIKEELKSLGTWEFPYLMDLFIFAKKENFFDKISPNASDWYVADSQMLVEAEHAIVLLMLNNYYPAEEAYNYYASNGEEEYT